MEPGNASGDYQFYGYRLRSEIPLRGWTAVDGAGQPDIHVREGCVPTELAAPSWSGPFLQVEGDTALVRIGQRLRILIRGGSEIAIQVGRECGEGDIDTFLASIVAGVILHRRRDLPLHASCVRFGGGAIAISGAVGLGKSTLAAALVGAGGELLTDDICRIQYAGPAALATPGPARMRLWPDAAGKLGLDRSLLRAAREGHPKLVMPVAGAKSTVPLLALIRLRLDLRVDQPYIERLEGPGSIMPAGDLVYRAALGRRLGNRAEVFRSLARLPASLPVYRLTRGENTPDLAAFAELALRVLQGLP